MLAGLAAQAEDATHVFGCRYQGRFTVVANYRNAEIGQVGDVVRRCGAERRWEGDCGDGCSSVERLPQLAEGSSHMLVAGLLGQRDHTDVYRLEQG
ncbi:hypothetical protein ASE08_00790 [Rhizobacter sp. Root16D2]|nr:hypothetical protein ASE08_00790 [Rhizobacter sp. Root16D2]